MLSAKTKVFLNLGKRPHSVYFELIRHPPEGVEYIYFPVEQATAARSAFYDISRGLWSRFADIHLPILPCYSPGCDLIHSTSSRLITTNSPWVVDTESMMSFLRFNQKFLSPRHFNRVLNAMGGDNCKAIIPWSHAAGRSIRHLVKYKKIIDKLRVVYPAIWPSKLGGNKRSGGKTNLLFIARHFYLKGGLDILKTFELLAGKYDVSLTVISDVPEPVKSKYGQFDGISFLPFGFSREKINEFYENADVFVLPTYADTFGMCFLEAMNYRLPVVTYRTFATPEIVADGRTGYLVEPPVQLAAGQSDSSGWGTVDECVAAVVQANKKEAHARRLAEKISVLIEKPRLARRFGRAGRREVVSGKFSTERRNKELVRIYETAIGRKI